MAGFCEIKLAEPLDNSLLGEHLPSRRIFVDFTKEPFLEIRLSTLYGRSDQDFKRFKKSKKRSALYNSIDYHPNYYEQDVITTSKGNFDSLDKHRDNILPFSEYKDEDNKKLQTFNTSQNNARFASDVRKTYGTDGTIYFNGPEPNVFNDIDFLNLSRQVLDDPFYFKKPHSTILISDMDYPYYVNNYAINKMGSAIYPFNVLEEIQLSLLTIKNIKGIKILFGWNDSRERNLLILNHIDAGNFSGLEPYDDEGAEGLLVSEEKSELKKFLLRYNNGDFLAEIDNQNVLQFNTITQEINYISEESDDIRPFKEDQSINNGIHFDHTDRVNIDDSIILDRAAGKATKPEFIPPNFRQYMSFGSDINYEYSNGLESIAFKGLMD